MDNPFWIFLDQIGIVVGLAFAIVEIVQLFWLWTISEDIEDIEEEIEENQ